MHHVRMTDDLYERYKETLRTGHVSVLRGFLPEAIEAYRFAAEIAPSRALPHTSLGGVYMRLGYLDQALTEYAAAVTCAPHDEGALLGQAEALVTAGRRSDSASVLDHVAEIQEAAGRLPEAADTLRRALELEEAPERSRHQRSLLRQIRFSGGDHAAEQLLARALRLRGEPSDAVDAGRLAPLRPAGPLAGAPLPSAPLGWRRDAAGALGGARARSAPELVSEPEPARVVQTVAELAVEVEVVAEAAAEGVVEIKAEPAPEPEPVVEAVAEAGDTAEAEAAPAADAEAAPEAALAGEPAEVPIAAAEAHESPEGRREGARAGASTQEPEAVGVMADVDKVAFAESDGAQGADQPQPTGDDLLAAAEAAEGAGDESALRSLLLGTARAYAREGRFEAGLDATHRLLKAAPSDVDAHLVLVELYVARNWDALAAEKLVLLGRLAELNDDEETRQRLCAVASRAFPMDDRLEALCS